MSATRVVKHNWINWVWNIFHHELLMTSKVFFTFLKSFARKPFSSPRDEYTLLKLENWSLRRNEGRKLSAAGEKKLAMIREKTERHYWTLAEYIISWNTVFIKLPTHSSDGVLTVTFFSSYYYIPFYFVVTTTDAVKLMVTNPPRAGKWYITRNNVHNISHNRLWRDNSYP